MKVIAVLLVSFLAALLLIKVIKGQWDFTLSGCIGMCVMLFFTALGHFLFPKGMAMMIPSFIPFKLELVYLTAIIEIAAGIGLLFPAYRRLTAILLILFFILITPANIYAALHHINLEKATFDGEGPSYLWKRIPEQIFYIGWVWYFGIWSASALEPA